jgi:hypothetical protein
MRRKEAKNELERKEGGKVKEEAEDRSSESL